MARKITTSISQEEYRKIGMLKREGINISDLIRVALIVHSEAPDLFYSIMYRLDKAKKSVRP
jgi:hypothetical protein